MSSILDIRSGSHVILCRVYSTTAVKELKGDESYTHFISLNRQTAAEDNIDKGIKQTIITVKGVHCCKVRLDGWVVEAVSQ